MNIDLEKIFGFVKSELAENRIGKLSAKQTSVLQNQLKRESFWSKFAFFAFILPVFIFFGIAIYQMGFDFGKNYQLIFAFATITIIALGIFSFFVIFGKIRSDLSSYKISMVKGCPRKSFKEMPRKSLGVAYFIEIEGVKFQLDSKKKFDALNESQIYRVHFIKHPPVQIILSLEVEN